MSYKGQVLRGEKWNTLCPNTTNKSKKADIAVYLESQKKVETPKEDTKSKVKK